MAKICSYGSVWRQFSTVFRTLRTLATLAIVGGLLWGAFTLRLGSKTFAEHIDSIGETAEAKELLDGTRSTVNPALEDAKERVLGEYVEAPTYVPEGTPSGFGAAGVSHDPPHRPRRLPGSAHDAIPARAGVPGVVARPGARPSSEHASTEDQAKLPGRR
jgi:hypothetical protein